METIFWFSLVIFAVIEVLIPLRLPVSNINQRWVNNFSLLIINHYLLPLVFPFYLLYSYLNITTLEKPFILQILIYIILYDFINYWSHRLFHKVKFLWKLHLIHHDDLDLDISTSVRHHPLEIILYMVLSITIFLILGGDLVLLTFAIITSQTFSFFQHSNIKINKNISKKINYIFVTPNFHRVHHGSHISETNKNYGNIFSIWDKIFRTYKESYQSPLGLNKSSKNLKEILISPFKK